MKELSIEEKAKAYDEAIERAKVFKEHLLEINDKGYADEIDYIFPELKESEDERIRKSLLGQYKRFKPTDYYDDGITFGDVVSWLEKQGEQIDFANREYWRGYREGKQEILDKYADFEKQSEQKPVVIPKFRVGDIIRHKEQGFTCKIIAVDTEYRVSDCSGTHLPFDMQDYYELVGLKPAWSEEDKNILNAIAYTVKNSGYNHCIGVSNEMMITFIKSLKDRVLPKQE